MKPIMDNLAILGELLSKISNYIDLVKLFPLSYKLLSSVLRKYSIQSDDGNLENGILLWGDTSSGKSTLINAFIKQLEILSELDKHDFRYTTLQVAGNMTTVLKAQDDKVFGTSDFDEKMVLIGRHLKEKTPNKKYKGKILEHSQHQISILDARGSLINDYGQIIRTSVVSFENIIAVLDCTGGDVGKKRAVEGLQFLCHQLSIQNPERKKNLAICLTKTDGLNFGKGEMPKAMFKTHFGIDPENITIYASQKINLNIHFFATSAFGYILDKENKKHKPNYSPESGWLLDRTQWEPYNAHAPFFWVFNLAEEHHWHKKEQNLKKRIVWDF